MSALDIDCRLCDDTEVVWLPDREGVPHLAPCPACVDTQEDPFADGPKGDL